jgi:competence protein ComEC
LVVLTHFHADHVGGLADALSGRDVGELAHGPPCGQDASPALSIANGAGATVHQIDDTRAVSAQAGAARITLYPSPLAVLCPAGVSSGEDQAANDAGLAVLAESSGVYVWALGDLEQSGQAALLRTLRQEAMPSAVTTEGGAEVSVPGSGAIVVVAHHGSAKQSEPLAQALAPGLSIMSAGRDNSYGHPSQATLDLYAKFGMVKRTDQDGLIVIRPGDLRGAEFPTG